MNPFNYLNKLGNCIVQSSKIQYSKCKLRAKSYNANNIKNAMGV